MSEQFHVLTAFTVVVDKHGHAFAVPDLLHESLVPEVPADPQLIKSACDHISDDIYVTNVALRTAQLLAPAPETTQQERLLKALQERGKQTTDE